MRKYRRELTVEEKAELVRGRLGIKVEKKIDYRFDPDGEVIYSTVKKGIEIIFSPRALLFYKQQKRYIDIIINKYIGELEKREISICEIKLWDREEFYSGPYTDDEDWEEWEDEYNYELTIVIDKELPFHHQRKLEEEFSKATARERHSLDAFLFVYLTPREKYS